MAARTHFYLCFFLHLSYVIVLHTAHAQNGTSESTSTFDFDCHRPGVSCGEGNQCNLATGKCNCNNNSTDYMCRPPGPDCPEDQYGERCSFKRVQVVCSSTGMLVNVNPHGKFEGTISVYDKSGGAACTFVNISTLTALEDVYGKDYREWIGYGIDLNHNNVTCGIANETSTDQTITYTRHFIVQYSKYFVSAIDQIITAKCSSNKENLTVFGSIPSVVNQDQFGLNNVTVDDEVDLVTLKIVKAADGKPLKNEDKVVLGDKIELIFEGAQVFRLVKCEANNAVNQTADLVTANCPDEKAKSLFYDNILTNKENGKFQVILRLKIFRFTDSAKVAFVCNVTLCGNDLDCSQLNCTGFSAAVPLSTTTAPPNTTPTTPTTPGSNETNFNNTIDANETTTTTTTTPTTAAVPIETSGGRRRRSANAKDSTTLSGSLTVVDSPDQLTVDTTSPGTTSSSDCPQDSNLLVLVILLAVVVVILLCCIGVVVAWTMRAKSKVTTRRDTRYVEPVQTMRIPRLELNTTNLNQPC
ncbi:unnamed protein product [Lymnaea stagnalis]|uniref:ZP domain-containing protein n=1 Tax=Lymnaea stagnalis TaxID=6523 RepID=A0AAV2H625_LYMST